MQNFSSTDDSRYTVYPLAVGEVPPPSPLSNLLEIGTSASDQPLADHLGIQAPAHLKNTLPVTIGVSLPPVSGKLVKQIEAGYFIEMGELLPKGLGAANIGTDDEGFKASKPKPKPVTTILEWAQCFGIYVVVLSRTQPERVPDLLAYQALISSRLKWNARVTAGWITTEHFVSELCLSQTSNGPLWTLLFRAWSSQGREKSTDAGIVLV